ncbi:MAG TPA: hypothetical protein VMV49_08140 [Candidatus Deferrimicrobium sp.]|nr:hypothetical protein [Candidatus Deferrimicrobium sp.]
MHKKSRPLDIKIEIVNIWDWKTTNNLILKVKGLFRNSMWKVKEHSHKIIGDSIDLIIQSTKVGDFGAMVLTPFEIIEKIQLVDTGIIYKIKVIVDGEECTAFSL